MSQYLEDFAVGQILTGPQTLTVTAADIKAFATQFDAQPFHLDESAAEASIFRGLAASGWHTAALTMTLLLQSDFRPTGGIIGAGSDEISWPRPTRPGDILGVRCEVLDVKPSTRNPRQGTLKARVTTFNAAGEPVQVAVMKVVVPRRPTS